RERRERVARRTVTMCIALRCERVRLHDRAAAVGREELRIAGSARCAGPTRSTDAARARSMERAPHQHILASAGDERVYRLDNRTRDHPGLDLRVPSQVGRERKMIHHPRDSYDVLTVAI